MAMPRASTEDWIQGESDLKESIVEDVPQRGKSVKIRALSATTANMATSQAVRTEQSRVGPQMRFDAVKLDILRFANGVVEPKVSEEEARVISARYGPAFQKVVQAINELSGIDNESIQDTDARFPSGGNGAAPPGEVESETAGNDRPAISPRGGGE